jgi:uncharacterized protein (TIGR02217 family)
VNESLSGKESRIAYRQFPRILFSIEYSVLREQASTNELKQLVGLFNALLGSYDTFLYSDPEFNSVTAENFGTGNGSTTQFQLVARYQNVGGPGYAERVQNLSSSPSIFVNGVLQTLTTHYTIGTTGIITFVTPPTSGHALTWTGTFNYRCRFMDDSIEFEKMMAFLWATEFQFISVPL